MSSAGTTNYEWDPLNRMASAGVSTGYNSYYHYRADGLRAVQLRAASGTNTRITAYRYDGQMPVQEAFSFGSTVETTRFAGGPQAYCGSLGVRPLP
ncbi:hypothetical protein EON80_25930 [bacterium]|nr:MAG: hypothetical protein EON80_25930 [bacterium]